VRVLLCLILHAYKATLSRVLSRWLCCRFYPTCADYSRQAIEKHGPVRGLRMTLNRLRRCRPDNFDSCIDFP
jgi:uncharacterized protein